MVKAFGDAGVTMNGTVSKARWRVVVWSIWVVAALFMLPVLGGAMFAVVVAGSALLLAAVPGAVPQVETRRNGRDLFVIATMYLAVVGLLRLASDLRNRQRGGPLTLAFVIERFPKVAEIRAYLR